MFDEDAPQPLHPGDEDRRTPDEEAEDEEEEGLRGGGRGLLAFKYFSQNFGSRIFNRQIDRKIDPRLVLAGLKTDSSILTNLS